MPDTNKVKRNVQKMLEQGASEREIDAYIASEGVSAEQLRGGKPYKAPAAQAPIKPYETRERKSTGWSGIGSGLMGAAQGLTFGFADEIAAGAQQILPEALGGNRDGYDAALRRRRRDFANAQADNPNAYVAGDVGGSVLGAVVPGGLAVRGAGTLARGAGLGSRVGRASVAGGAGGALRGAGDGTDARSRAEGALTGGLTGAALGGGLAGTGTALRAGGDLTNRGLDAGVKMLGQTVDNVMDGPLARMVTGTPARGRNGQMVKRLGPMADELVDQGTDYLAARGPLGRRAAGMIGDAYKDQIGGSSGLMGRAAMSTIFPGALETEATLRGGAMAASGLGRGLEGITRSRVGTTQVGALPADRSTRYSIEDEEVLNRVAGTRWEDVLLEAQERGPQAMRATLFTLKKNPQFREETGLQLGEDNADDFGSFGGFDDSGF